MLRRSGIDLKTLDVDKLRSGYARLEQQKNEISNAYRSSEKELKQMNTELDKLKQYLGTEQDNETEKIVKKSHRSNPFFILFIHFCFHIFLHEKFC